MFHGLPGHELNNHVCISPVKYRCLSAHTHMGVQSMIGWELCKVERVMPEITRPTLATFICLNIMDCIKWWFCLFLATARKGNVFRSVCQSFCSGEGWWCMMSLPGSGYMVCLGVCVVCGHCSSRHAFYWNAFLFIKAIYCKCVFWLFEW